VAAEIVGPDDPTTVWGAVKDTWRFALGFAAVAAYGVAMTFLRGARRTNDDGWWQTDPNRLYIVFMAVFIPMVMAVIYALIVGAIVVSNRRAFRSLAEAAAPAEAQERPVRGSSF
jgi:hypothetical protein